MAGVVAAKNYASLAQAVWTQTANADYIPIQEESFFVPGKETLYLHLREERASETKAWSPDTVRAVGTKTGKINGYSPLLRLATDGTERVLANIAAVYC
ncbi:hypothetical protein D3C75_851730 [compost metagenome]